MIGELKRKVEQNPVTDTKDSQSVRDPSLTRSKLPVARVARPVGELDTS